MSDLIRRTASFAERAERLEAVRQKYIAFRNSVKQDLGFENHDGRLTFLRNIISLSRSTVVFLYLFHRCGANDRFAMEVFGLTSQESIGPQIRNTNKYVKLSWCTQFQFQIENLFRNILKELRESVPAGYWNISQKLVKSLGMQDRIYCQQVLNILAFIRNSQHANGTHFGYKEQDTIIKVDGVPFEFRHGAVIQCATWDHIAHAWLNVLSILRQIYNNERVLEIREVPDRFY